MSSAQDSFAGWSYYTYNADGQRTRRKINNQETWQVYGMDGELLAEYAANGAATSPQKEYGYRNGELLVTSGGSPRLNVAASANGGTATASETNSAPYAPSGAINGDRKLFTNNAWANLNPTLPQWLQVDFNGSKTIDEIDVFSVQNSYGSPSEPTLSMTFSLYGVTAFQAQYWNGSAWVTVPNGSVTGNNKVWKQLTFSTITTSKIRILISGTSDGYSRLTEVEAWGTAGGGVGTSIQWLVTDQLGTPRMVFDQTGSLANVKRHDYLPFGEELFAGTGARTPQQGYSGGDGVRQQFTQKERDIETGLDYFLARYYSSTQGRFTSADPMLASGRPAVPQSWNRYTYVLNSPLVLVDPDGLDWGVTEWDDKNGHHTRYSWFDGKIGKRDGRTYTAVNFGKSGSLDIAADGGALIRISNLGIIRQVIGGGPGGDGPSTGQENLNASAGLVDGAIPLGKQIREGLFGRMGIDTNAPEYENAAAISAGVAIGVSLLDGAGEVKIAGCLVESAAPARIYSARVLLRSAEEGGPMHNFPESFNAQIFQGSRTVTRNFFKVDRQALSNDAIMYRAPGSINGRAGTFEIGVRPSVSGGTEVITHRFFRPGP